MRAARYISTSLLTFSMTLMASTALAGPQSTLETKARPDVTPVHKVMPEQANRIQVALLLDTSNSMDGLIDQAKSQLWTLVNELGEGRRYGQAPVIEIALYEYGNSNISIAKGYVRQVQEFTTDLDAVSEQLFSLTTNGGDEYAGQVITAAVDDLHWSTHRDAMKLVIIAGNEPFTQGPISYQSACKRARKNNIIIDTIHCGSEKDGIRGKWKAGADCGGGLYMTINQDEKLVHIPTPYDDELDRLNTRLNDTYFGYGNRGREFKQRQIAQDSNAEAMSDSIKVSRLMSKASGNYKNESWDVVDAYKADKSAILELEDEALPEEMKGLDKDARIAFVETKTAERKAAQAEIAKLQKQRSEFIAEKRKDMAETKTLDNVMVEGIKRQAIERGFEFDGVN